MLITHQSRPGDPKKNPFAQRNPQRKGGMFWYRLFARPIEGTLSESKKNQNIEQQSSAPRFSRIVQILPPEP